MKTGHNRFKIIAVLAAMMFIFTSAAPSDFRLGKDTEILINMMRDLNIFYVDELDPDKILSDAAEGMTRSLDPYTEYIPAEDMAEFELMTTGKYGGIGSLIRKKDEYVMIAQPYKGSPADKAGLRIGDLIVAINGKDSRDYDVEKVSSLLKGDPGTTVRLTVRKFNTGQDEEIVIMRERISIPGVPYYGFISDGIGYIIHSDFTEDCSSDMRNALMELKKDGNLKGLILDYRNNGGGILQEAVKVLSMFVPKGTEVVSMKGKIMETPVSFKTETEPVDLEVPLVVLVNRGSASAAEIVAGALQDLDRAVLVGQRTYGKGLVQATRPLGYNSYLKLTTAKYYIPSGRCIQAIDYAQRNEDGSVAAIPDSLIREFHTVGGRKVYDGGGVMPDIITEPEHIGRFTILAYGKGYIDDFSDLYVKNNPEPVELMQFSVTDEIYDQFVRFMEDKEMEYESDTKLALNQLKKKSETDLYYEKIEEHIRAIEKEISDDNKASLELYRDQLSELIENNIVLRHHYAEGVAQHKVASDPEIVHAKELLMDIQRYDGILSGELNR